MTFCSDDETILEKICDFFSRIWNNITTFYYNVKNGISNICKWLPVIWKDRNWDYYFIYVILHKKLTLMKNTFNSDKVHIENNDIIVDEINIVLKSLDNLIKDNYCDEEYEEYYNERGEMKFEKTENGMYRLVDDRPEEEIKKSNKKLHELFSKEEMLRNKDLDIVFSTMKDKILGWWD